MNFDESTTRATDAPINGHALRNEVFPCCVIQSRSVRLSQLWPGKFRAARLQQHKLKLLTAMRSTDIATFGSDSDSSCSDSDFFDAPVGPPEPAFLEVFTASIYFPV